MWHRGERIARSLGTEVSYCCGVTFQAFLIAWAAVDPSLGGLSPTELRELLHEWFCPTMGHSGAVAALVSRGLGVAVAPREAQPGDLLQLWRRVDLANPSGHAAVFLAWEGDHLRYLSSQPATQGIAEHVEEVGPDWAIYVVRAAPQGLDDPEPKRAEPAATIGR